GNQEGTSLVSWKKGPSPKDEPDFLEFFSPFDDDADGQQGAPENKGKKGAGHADAAQEVGDPPKLRTALPGPVPAGDPPPANPPEKGPRVAVMLQVPGDEKVQDAPKGLPKPGGDAKDDQKDKEEEKELPPLHHLGAGKPEDRVKEVAQRTERRTA